MAEDVERIAGNDCFLDVALDHLFGHDRRSQQVAAELGKDAGPALASHLVAGASHPLQPGGHRDGCLYLDDQVDRSHVDPKLEARGGHDRPELSPLESLFDEDSLLA